MNKSRWIIATVAGLLLVAAGGASAWWLLKPPVAAAVAAPAKADPGPHKYVSLDKVIVMLRRGGSDATPHYLALDLVFKTPDQREKLTKEHLPMLRSVAVKALSSYTMDKATTMTIEQFTEAINAAFTDSYAQEKQDKPFSEAMIGKLIVE